MAQPEITAYLKTHCGWSRGVRAILKKYNLEYQEKDIIQNPENYEEMIQVSGQDLQPTLIVNGEVVADVSGDELEEYLVEHNLVEKSDATTAIPTDRSCSDEEHAMQGDHTRSIQLDVKNQDNNNNNNN